MNTSWPSWVIRASGLEARAYRRSDILDQYEGEEREKVAEALDKNPLLRIENAEDLPDTPDDLGLQGLAERVQNFLDLNSNLMAILEKQGMIPWP